MRVPGPKALLVFAAGLTGLGAPACRGSGPRARAEATALRRQTQELRRLLAAVERDQVFSSHHVAVGIRQELVRDLVQLTLPIEAALAGGIELRLEAAEVAFLGGESRVTLRGRVRRRQDPETWADLTALGGIHGVTVGARSGLLGARVALDRLEVRTTGVPDARRDWLEGMIEQVGAQSLSSLADQIPPLAIPVRFERTLGHPGITVGPVTIAAAQIPLRVEVAEVIALRGRLWVLLDVSADPGRAGASRAGDGP